jgi:cell wall-associated NlpC family hydrolase
VTIVPVTDLIGAELAHEAPQTYAMLPASSAEKNCSSCPRMHQLLYNELVYITDQGEKQYKVAVPNSYFTTDHHRKEHEYWVLKEHVVPLKELNSYGVTQAHIPQPISFKKRRIKPGKTVALAHPYYDPITKQTYSIGTRFVLAPEQSNPNSVSVYAFDRSKKQLATVPIAKAKCCAQPEKTREEQVKQFVTLLKQWAHPEAGIIAYVWGGSSCTTNCSCHVPTKKEGGIRPLAGSYYTCDTCIKNPRTGFDCSGLVLRAAQLAGIPLFCKNTRTLAAELSEVDTAEQIETGDLILIPGHVMIISDRARNLIIEARSYDHGYGKVHEIKLDREFKDIETFEQLYEHNTAGKPLLRLNAEGAVVEKVPFARIVRLKSCWH